jgi:hypothetical protein
MLNTLLRHLGISPNPKETQGSGNPDEGKVSATIEKATEAMKNLIDSTLAPVSNTVSSSAKGQHN